MRQWQSSQTTTCSFPKSQEAQEAVFMNFCRHVRLAVTTEFRVSSSWHRKRALKCIALTINYEGCGLVFFMFLTACLRPNTNFRTRNKEIPKSRNAFLKPKLVVIMESPRFVSHLFCHENFMKFYWIWSKNLNGEVQRSTTNTQGRWTFLKEDRSTSASYKRASM